MTVTNLLILLSSLVFALGDATSVTAAEQDNLLKLLTRDDTLILPTLPGPEFEQAWLDHGRLFVTRGVETVAADLEFGEQGELVFVARFADGYEASIMIESDESPGEGQVAISVTVSTPGLVIRGRGIVLPEPVPGTTKNVMPAEITETCVCSVRTDGGCNKVKCDNGSACGPGHGACYWDSGCPAKIGVPMLATIASIGLMGRPRVQRYLLRR